MNVCVLVSAPVLAASFAEVLANAFLPSAVASSSQVPGEMAFPAVTTLGTGGVYGSGGVYGAPVVETFGAPAITSVGGGVYGAGGVIGAPVVETFGAPRWSKTCVYVVVSDLCVRGRLGLVCTW